MPTTLSARLALGFGLVVLIMAVSTAVSIYSMERLASFTEDLYDHPLQVSKGLAGLDGSLIRLHRELRKVQSASSTAEVDESVKEISRLEGKANAAMEIVRKRFLGPPSMLEDISRIMADLKEIRERTISLKRQGKEVPRGETSKKLVEAEKALNALQEWADRKAVSFHEHAIETARQIIVLTAVLGVASAILALLAGYFIARSIAVPLKAAVGIAQGISEGDLGQKIEVRGVDETVQLLSALQKMQGKLGEMARQISSGVESLSSAASQLSVAAEQVSKSTELQSAAASSVSAAVEEMSVSIGHVTENAEQARKISAESGDLSASGGNIIRSTAEEIGKVSRIVAKSSLSIQELNRQSAHISGIAGVIKEIADQTNLLALNAAIESARAGEVGRGFAVVADEVRKLAERTTQSTQEIASMILHIQEGTRDAVASMGEAENIVGGGASMAKEAGESVQHIQEGASEVVRMVNVISDSLREQSAASEEIAKNVEKIAQMIEENNAAVKETASAAESLDRLAISLKGMVGWFRI